MTEHRVRQLSDELRISERRRHETQRLSGVGFWELDHQNDTLYWSEEIFAIYELPSESLEPNYEIFLSLIHDEDRELVNEAYRSSVESGSEYNIRYRIKAADDIKWIEARGVTYYDDKGAPTRSIGTALDVSETVSAQQEIERLAFHDALTNLPNRQLFSNRLTAALQAAERASTSVLVLFIDLDNFKLINDGHGHDVGDEVLVAVAERLQEKTRSGDSFARIGGDEFAGVLVDLDDADVDDAVNRVKHAIDGSYETRSRRFDVTASIGVTSYPRDSSDPDILLRHADQAMYEAKERGKSRIRYFDTDRFQSNWSRHQLQQEIQRAIETDQFVLHYQPRVSLANGSLAGAEALLRWNTPQGAVPPLEVITAISGTDLEWELDSWVIRKVLEQSQLFTKCGIAGPVSLNINPSSIENPAFPDHLSSLLAHSSTPTQGLEIEILEVSSIDDFERTGEVLRRCRELGLSFSLDDFGTGYSSLTHFHALPIDKLKIDRRFVQNLNTNPENLTLVKSILAIARANNRPVVAEGIESDEVAKTLTELGCDFGQGFGLARPLAISDYIACAQTWDPEAFLQRIHSSA